MSFPAPKLTLDGRELSLNTLAGEKVIFTRLAIGDGQLTGQAPSTLTHLVHELLSINIHNLRVSANGHVTVRGSFTNTGLTGGFYWRELGLYAKTGAGDERLYCYSNAYELAEYIAAAGSEIIEKVVSLPLVVGDAENVTAVIDQSLVYATQEDLAGKADFDLGNVTNADFMAKADAALLGADGKIPAGLLPEIDVSGAVSTGIQAHNADAQAHAGLMTGKANQSDFAAHTGNAVGHLTAAERTAWNAKADQTALNSHVGNTTAHLTAAERTAWNAKGAPYRFTATIPTSGWSGSASAGYNITIAVSGLVENASAPPVIDVVQSTDTAAAKLQLQSWGNVSKIMVSNGSITVYCHEKLPGVNIPIQICGVKV